MPVTINRKPIHFSPDSSRVIVRFFMPGGEERAKKIITRIISMEEDDAAQVLNHILRDFSHRHRNITRIFLKHFDHIAPIAASLGYMPAELSKEKQFLIGSYFTNEYSIESAAFFNPSVVEDPDQSHLQIGQKRIIVSFRATGEGHVSSIVFRSGIIDSDNNFEFCQPGRFVDEAETIQLHRYRKSDFLEKLCDVKSEKPDLIASIFSGLNDSFTFTELRNRIAACTNIPPAGTEDQKILNTIKWMADAQYLVSFSLDSTISERVIFPVTDAESRGIEDARFVKFSDDNGKIKYFGTYTAYNGFSILPQLIETIDFCTFKVMPIYGSYAQNKGMALFPRKINGRFAMLSRVDGENNYIMFSDSVNIWDTEPKLLQEPEYPWEFVQLGNSGSPIETDRGWLVITHGVGAMRRYCLGAILLDLHNPEMVIAKLTEPLLIANEDEREGYVPNVVYSCGAILNGNAVVIPYAMSDTRSGFLTTSLTDLINKMQGLPGSEQMEFKKEKRILIVEDDECNQLIIGRILENNGYSFVTASDGLQALVEIGRNKYDLILSDVNMPNFSGYELLEFMKNKKMNIPLMFLTGNTTQEDEIKGLQLGAVDYLRKPIDPQLLLLKLHKHCSGQSGN